eukprot:m.654219 g.654219  ORF g.654219 m.654219 type:complete len:52 (+) comp22691_c2_seq66:3878-4033(+)
MVGGRCSDRSPLWVATPWNHTMSHYKIESWQQRKAGIRVRLRIPKFIFSHR